MNQLLGVGYPLIDRSLAELREQDYFLGRVRGLDGAFVLVNVEDEVTGTEATVHRVVVGAEVTRGGAKAVLKDWESLLRVNAFEPLTTDTTPPSPTELSVVHDLINWLEDQLLRGTLPFRRPKYTATAAFLPEVAP